MKAIHQPTKDQLHLGNANINASLSDVLLQSFGDPCYLHELGSRLNNWSRKQIEVAVRNLEKQGAISRYGLGTRRLYASKRNVPDELKLLSARAVRVLQILPLEGPETLSQIRGLISDGRQAINELISAKLVTELFVKPTSFSLTDQGRKLAATLGDGLRMHIGVEPQLRNIPDQELSSHISAMLMRSEIIPEPEDLYLRAATRKAISSAISKACKIAWISSGFTIASIENQANKIIKSNGSNFSKEWFANIIYIWRLPNTAEVEALSKVLKIPREYIDMHIRLAPWSLNPVVKELENTRKEI